jgi:hypothetical protein
MTRNVKEVSLIQIRTGDQANLPKALHQSEFGLAKDKNRIFIGNAANADLKNRTTEFPYQNLEILTEFSELKDYFKYSYENNIDSVIIGDVIVSDRNKFKESLPIVIKCTKENPQISSDGKHKINGIDVELKSGNQIHDIIASINAVSSETQAYAIKMPGTDVITFVSFGQTLDIDDDLANTIGYPTFTDPYNSMPSRMVTEKLDDFLNITDFGIKGDGGARDTTAKDIYSSLLEVYKNYNDEQFFRDVFFPAGKYIYQVYNSTAFPFPLVSNLKVHGEGIDRTIIRAYDTNFNKPLLNGVDGYLNMATDTNNYGKGGYPTNICIEDMTFSGSDAAVICNLPNVENITFSRVKFVGINGGNELIHINSGKNISFTDCVFEKGNCGIKITGETTNVSITHCQFIDIKTQALLIGDEEGDNVRGVNVTSNIFTNCSHDNDSNYVIKLGNKAQYVSIHQSIFDKEVVERTGNTNPYNDDEFSDDRKNYIDTLNPNTDTKKLLRFAFTQPKWEYIDYLCNQDGKIVLSVDKKYEDGEYADNGLNIGVGELNELIISSVKKGNVEVQVDANSDLILGSANNVDDKNNEEGNIVIKKTLELNNNIISNSTGTENITIRPSTEKYINIDTSESTTPYAQLVLNKTNAVPNVGYVNKVAETCIMKEISYQTIEQYLNEKANLIEEGQENNLPTGILLEYFDPKIYGNNISITDISVNVMTPFYPMYDYVDTSYNCHGTVEYKKGYVYYKGDVVTKLTDNGRIFAIVLKQHLAEDDNVNNIPEIENELLKIIPSQKPSSAPIKYVDVVGQADYQQYELTKTYCVDYSDPSKETSQHTIDITKEQKTNIYGEKYNVEHEYKSGDIAEYQGATYVINFSDSYVDENNNHVSKEFFTDEKGNEDGSYFHHPSLSTRLVNKGYDYKFSMDRTFNPKFENDNYNSSIINFSNGYLYLNFYDKDGNIIDIESVNQLNPVGRMIVKIEYKRNEI